MFNRFRLPGTDTRAVTGWSFCNTPSTVRKAEEERALNSPALHISFLYLVRSGTRMQRNPPMTSNAQAMQPVERLPPPSPNPLPLSATQEQQVRDLYYKRVRGYCAEEIKRIVHPQSKTPTLLQTGTKFLFLTCYDYLNRIRRLCHQSNRQRDVGLSEGTAGDERVYGYACDVAGTRCCEGRVVRD